MQSVGCHPSPAEVGGLGLEFIKYLGLYLGLPVHVLAYIGVISHSLNAKCRYLGILKIYIIHKHVK